MILVDTSVWVDHFRRGEPALVGQLDAGRVLTHPWVIVELALGHLVQRAEVLKLLNGLFQTTMATSEEVLALIEEHELYGLGIGCVDVQLLASAVLTPEVQLWTGDKRLSAVADRLGCSFDRSSIK